MESGKNNILSVKNIKLGISNGPTLIEDNTDCPFEINEGEVVLLMGLNGCGKTTLIESLFGQGFRNATIDFSCEKSFWGKDYSANDIISLIGYSENEIDSSNNWHTFWGSLKSLSYGYKDGFDQEYAENLFSYFCDNEKEDKEYKRLKNRLLGKCSGGQRKKFSILKALVRKDAILYIFDEPVNCLDTATMIKFRNYIRNNKGKKSAFLIITHCKIFDKPDRVYYIKNKKLLDYTNNYNQADCLNDIL